MIGDEKNLHSRKIEVRLEKNRNEENISLHLLAMAGLLLRTFGCS